MKIKGAIFDCDGTLVDSLGFWETLYEKIGERYFDNNFHIDPADDRAMRTQNIHFLARLLHEKYGVAESIEELRAFAEEILTWFYAEAADLKPGVRELLAFWKSKNVRMCIASASEVHSIRMVLGRHGVLEYFEDIIPCTSVGVGKDKPDVFYAAEKFLGTPHEQTFVLEDSMLAIETAKKAGFPVVGIYDKHTFGQERARELSDIYIEQDGSFAELIPLFED